MNKKLIMRPIISSKKRSYKKPTHEVRKPTHFKRRKKIEHRLCKYIYRTTFICKYIYNRRMHPMLYASGRRRIGIELPLSFNKPHLQISIGFSKHLKNFCCNFCNKSFTLMGILVLILFEPSPSLKAIRKTFSFQTS